MRPGKKRFPFLALCLLVAVVVIGAVVLQPLAVDYWLIQQLDDETRWRSAADRLIERRSLRGLARVAETALRRDTEDFAAWEKKLLARFRLDIKWALPGFSAALASSEPSVRREALNALRRPWWRIDEAVPVVAQVLECDDPRLRWQAAYILGEMGPGAHAAVPVLIRALEDLSEHVRWAAALGLGGIARVTHDQLVENPIPALIGALDDPDPRVASQAADALAGYGSTAAQAIPALTAKLESKEMLADAAIALAAIGGEARRALPRLLELLESGEAWNAGREIAWPVGGGVTRLPEDEPDFVRLEYDNATHLPVLVALDLGAGADDLLSHLLALLRSPDAERRKGAIGALAALGRAATPAVPRLIELLAQGVEENRYRIVGTLGEIGAVPELLEGLTSAHEPVWRGCAVALATIEPVSNEVLEALELVAERDPWFLPTLAWLQRRSAPQVDVVSLLLEGGRHGNSVEGYAFLVGPEGKISLPELVSACGDPDENVAAAAAELLGRVGDGVPEAVSQLVRSLESNSSRVRQAALRAMGNLVSDADVIVPVLLGVLESESALDDGMVTVHSLTRFGPRAAAALPTIRDRFAHPDWTDELDRLAAALVAIGGHDPDVLGFFLDQTEESFAPFQSTEILEYFHEYLDELHRRGPGSIHLGGLARALEHWDLLVRIKAARCYWSVTGDSDRFLPLYRRALFDQWHASTLFPMALFFYFDLLGSVQNPARREAARVLAELGAAGRAAVPELRANLRYADPGVRALAAEALWELTGEAELDILIDVLESSDRDRLRPRIPPAWSLEQLTVWRDRAEPAPTPIRDAVRILGEIGPPARPALPRLEKFLSIDRLAPFLRDEIEIAIARIRGETPTESAE